MSDATAADPNAINGIVLQGRVIDKVLQMGGGLRRHFIALEEQPGGQFFALHAHKGFVVDLAALVGRWVEVEGDIWFQSLTARSITPAEEPTG